MTHGNQRRDELATARVSMFMPPSMKGSWQAQAKKSGLSLTEWIIQKCKGDL